MKTPRELTEQYLASLREIQKECQEKGLTNFAAAVYRKLQREDQISLDLK